MKFISIHDSTKLYQFKVDEVLSLFIFSKLSDYFVQYRLIIFMFQFHEEQYRELIIPALKFKFEAICFLFYEDPFFHH